MHKMVPFADESPESVLQMYYEEQKAAKQHKPSAIPLDTEMMS